MTRVVIDIPDDNYKRIRELAEVNGLSNNLMGYSLLAIAHGTVLSKGHEDLISRSALKETFIGYTLFTANTVIEHIDNAPTVDLWEMRQEATENALKKAEVLYARPQGEWFVNPHSMVMKCMNCGHEETAKDVGVVDKDKHFCYWCGADMRGEKND